MNEVRAIFITGGGSGIGRAVARLFAARGWRVGIADVDAAGLAETAAMLPKGMIENYLMDVRDRHAWTANLDAFTQASGVKVNTVFVDKGLAERVAAEERAIARQAEMKAQRDARYLARKAKAQRRG